MWGWQPPSWSHEAWCCPLQLPRHNTGDTRASATSSCGPKLMAGSPWVPWARQVMVSVLLEVWDREETLPGSAGHRGWRWGWVSAVLESRTWADTAKESCTKKDE